LTNLIEQCDQQVFVVNTTDHFTDSVEQSIFWSFYIHAAFCSQSVPEHSLGGLAEVRHEVDADQADAEYSLKLKPFDQPHRIQVLVGDVHARS